MLNPDTCFEELGEIEQKHRRKAKIVKYNLKLKNISAMTSNQKKAFIDFFKNDYNLILHGVAGTGKTFISMYFALDQLIKGKTEQVIIVRSTVQGRDMGYMPGDESEKIAHFERPYEEICKDLFDNNKAYDTLKERKGIRFVSTSFMRGVTFDNSIVIVDESQNMNFQELDTIMTRMGEDSRIILCGDFRQDDLKVNSRKADKSGILQIIKIARNMPCMSLIEFGIDDIVRSGFVKEYIIAKEDSELN